jgi:hypothetical protein
MKPLTIIMAYVPEPWLEKTLQFFAASELVEEALIISQKIADIKIPKCRVLPGEALQSQKAISQIVKITKTRYLLFLTGTRQFAIEPGALEKLIEVEESRKAGIVYPDFYEEGEGGQGRVLHPLNDYQLGCIRDDFDFGHLMIFSTEAVRTALEKYGEIPAVGYAGLYDLRLKISIDYPLYHFSKPLYSVGAQGKPSGDNQLFAYVDPRNTDVQKEMETVFANYLKKIGAYIPHESLRRAGYAKESFPVEASVVIPVKNRHGTIRDAVESALSQETDFSFNVIVVDNYSTDGTTGILSELSGGHPSLKHLVPMRTDLGIGGCWNEAINSPLCGRYAIQLDSDDLYNSSDVLQRIVDMLSNGKYAMMIGSYTIVNEKLEVIPPGLIDHREWTDENGHNNALRINGLGAPRAFDTDIIRKIGFPNVSYGEDYAAALRICREYRIGRIYESLYLCRRWQGNTDATLTIEQTNRNNAFKDSIRTQEILARQEINRGVNP